MGSRGRPKGREKNSSSVRVSLSLFLRLQERETETHIPYIYIIYICIYISHAELLPRLMDLHCRYFFSAILGVLFRRHRGERKREAMPKRAFIFQNSRPKPRARHGRRNRGCSLWCLLLMFPDVSLATRLDFGILYNIHQRWSCANTLICFLHLENTHYIHYGYVLFAAFGWRGSSFEAGNWTWGWLEMERANFVHLCRYFFF